MSIDFNKRLGSGTYGDVFEASITAGPDKGMRVVVKRPRHSDDAQDFSSEGVNKEGFIEGGADHNAMCESMLEVESYMGKKTSEACPQVLLLLSSSSADCVVLTLLLSPELLSSRPCPTRLLLTRCS